MTPGETRTRPPVLAEGWTVHDDAAPALPAEHMERDLDVGERAAAGDGPTYRIWTNRRCIVVTRREARLPGYASAARASGREGWAVVIRDSGGTAIPHLPRTLQVTLALPRRRGEEPSIEAVYRALGSPVRRALATLGFDARFGQVPRSFCDGRFNLVVDGKKVAGSAQRWRGGIPGSGHRGGFILAHLSLFVGGDMREATHAVNRFLRRAGADGDFDPGAVTSLEALQEPDGAREDLLGTVRGTLLDVLGAGTSPGG